MIYSVGPIFIRISFCVPFSQRGDNGDRRGDWGRDRPEQEGASTKDGGERNVGERDEREGNGLTEEERERRLAEKMPKHKPPEGPVSVSAYRIHTWWMVRCPQRP